MDTLPLKNVRVLELAEGYAGPWAATVLADLGAEVIKVEAIRRMDLTRSQVRGRLGQSNYYRLDPGERPWNKSLIFWVANRNKLAATIDITQPQGREVLHDLVRVSDVVLTNMVTGVPQKLGIDYESLRRVRPDIIVVTSCGFGGTGPYARHVAMATTMDGATGHLWLRPYPDQDTSSIGQGAHLDHVNALTSALGVVLALQHRAATGQGQAVDVSGCEAFIPHLGETVLDYAMNGRVRGPQGNQHEWQAPHGVYRCRGEDNWIAISVESDAQWEALCQTLGHPEWAGDARFADGTARWANQRELDDLLENATRGWDHYELMHRLQAAGVPAGAVLDNKEVTEDPQFRERGFFQPATIADAGEVPLPGVPWRSTRADFRVRVPPAGLGEHNHHVYEELLGFAEEAMQRFREAGVLGEVPLNFLV